MSIPMFRWAFGINTSSENFFLILREVDGERMLALPIKVLEGEKLRTAEAIAKKPTTADLIKKIFDLVNIEVKKVEICDRKSGTFHAQIYLNQDNTEMVMDARPIDALIIATSVGAPIFALEEVIQKHGQLAFEKKLDDNLRTSSEYKGILENLSPDAFGKYKM